MPPSSPRRGDKLHTDEQLERLSTGGRGLGRIADRRPQQEDYLIRTLLPDEVAMPPFKYWWDNSGVLDQGNTGTCVGHAFAHRFEDSPTTHPGAIDPFNIYRWACDKDPWPGNDGPDYDYDFGTSADAAAMGLLTAGLIDSFHWEWAREQTEQEVDRIIQIIKTWVLTKGSVCLGTPWYESMFNPRYVNVAPEELRWALVIDETEGWYVGGHEIVIDGWHTWGPNYEVPRIKNSWGENWGLSGRASMHPDTLRRVILEGADFTLINEVTS